MMDLHKKIVARANIVGVGFIGIKYIVIGSQTVVHSPSSELRGPMVADT